MEEFWQNIKDTLILLVKVALILMLVDVVSVVFEFKMRIPFISIVTDWIFNKIAVL